MEEEKFNQIKYQNEFIKQKYDRVNLTVPKGKRRRSKPPPRQQVKVLMNISILPLIAI